MTNQASIDYEILSRDTVKQLQDRFSGSIEEKAQKAIPPEAPNPNVLLEAAKKLLIACARKAVEIKLEELTDVVKQGRDAIEQRTEEVDASLHNALRNIGSSYPSPRFSDAQLVQIDNAAHRRHEDDIVPEVFGNEDRLYLKLKALDNAQSDTQVRIGRYLRRQGYSIVDYSKGYATDKQGKQQFKIGKLLKAEPELLQAFMDDSSRSADRLVAVISRRPEDIARMSTGRAWASCMGSGGFNFNYVPKDIERGTLVAYLVSEKDPEIINPLARILIKPFKLKYKPLNTLSAMANKLFGREPPPLGDLFVPEKQYGLHSEEFQYVVKQFAEDRLNAGKRGQFKLPSALYQDGVSDTYVRKDGITTPKMRW